MRRTSLTLFLSLLITTLAVACGPDTEAGTGRAPNTPAADGTFVLIAQTDLVELLKNTSDFQRGVLQDGNLTITEYETAFLGFQQCIAAAGISFYKTPTLTALGRYDYLLLYPPDQVDAGKAAHAKCSAEYIDRVSQAWSRRDNPKAAEVLARARRAMRDCLRAGGVNAPDEPVEGDFRPLLVAQDPTFLSCNRAVQESQNLPGWGG